MRLVIRDDFIYVKPGHAVYGGFGWIGTEDSSYSTKAIGIDKCYIGGDKVITIEMSGRRVNPTPHYKLYGIFSIDSKLIQRWTEKYGFFFDKKARKQVAMLPIHLFKKQEERLFEEKKQEAKEQTFEDFCIQEGIMKMVDGQLTLGNIEKHEFDLAMEKYRKSKK